MFFGDYSVKEAKKKRIYLSIAALNERYKRNNYGKYFLEDFELASAIKDFLNLFLNAKENVVFELLSIYCKFLLAERKDEHPYREDNETDAEFEKRTIEWQYADFDDFAERLNEVLADFEVNIYLTRNSFTPKQDSKITEEIYTPVLSYLSDKKWLKVNEHLAESFKSYRDKKYSVSITNTTSALQAYLQILVRNKIGNGNVLELIKEGMKKNLIPNDPFAAQIFRNIESIFAQERQQRSIAHPLVINADEKSARLVLNLAMVFMQHCI